MKGELASRKCNTYGNKCLKGCLDPDYSHHHAFKIVGGSFLAEIHDKNLAEVEGGRYAKWSATVLRMRHCPLPWRDKSRMLLATIAQATYGQGTHSFTLADEALTKIRSNIMHEGNV